MLARFFDRSKGRKEAPPFSKARRAERRYAAQLRRLARLIGEMLHAYSESDPLSHTLVAAALERYAVAVEPWAEAVAARMLTEVANRDRQAWREASARLGRAVRHDIEATPDGATFRALLADQVDLIKSIPLEAAERVQKLAVEGLSSGRRASEIAADIQRGGEVSEARAELIARTEVGRAQTEFTRVRAQSVGSTHFVWRTAGDTHVRQSHRRLNGQSFRWDAPPECDPGYRALPGAIFNCRCYAEPLFADK